MQREKEVACREKGDNPIIGDQFGSIAVRGVPTFILSEINFTEQTVPRTLVVASTVP